MQNLITCSIMKIFVSQYRYEEEGFAFIPKTSNAKIILGPTARMELEGPASILLVTIPIFSPSLCVCLSVALLEAILELRPISMVSQTLHWWPMPKSSTNNSVRRPRSTAPNLLWPPPFARCALVCSHLTISSWISLKTAGKLERKSLGADACAPKFNQVMNRAKVLIIVLSFVPSICFCLIL